MFCKSVKDNKGFTLVEIMIALGILVGLSALVFQMTKDQANSMVKSKVNTDVGQFKSEVIALFGVPTNCNANVGLLAVNTSNNLSGINVCNIRTSGGCLTATDRVVRFPVVATVGPAGWMPTNTMISERVRVKSVTAYLGSVTGKALSIAKFTIKLETKPNLPRSVSANSSAVVEVIKEEQVEISIPVVMNGTTILGCPKSWNSTVAY